MAVARPIDTEDSRVNDDHVTGAMPKLYGAPAYARPPAAPVNPVERPEDPDDLPLEAERSADDEGSPVEVTSGVPSGVQGRAYESAVTAEADPADATGPAKTSARLRGRPFRLRIPGRG